MTKKITISDAARAVLYQVLSLCRPRDYQEMRALVVVFRDFGLEEVEALSASEDGKEKVQEFSAAKTSELDVSEAGAIHLRRQLDRIKEIFPAGEAADGKTVIEGIPVQWARLLFTLVEQLDREFPEESSKAA